MKFYNKIAVYGASTSRERLKNSQVEIYKIK